VLNEKVHVLVFISNVASMLLRNTASPYQPTASQP